MVGLRRGVFSKHMWFFVACFHRIVLRNQPTHIYKFVAETLEDELDQRALQEMKQIEAAQKAKGRNDKTKARWNKFCVSYFPTDPSKEGRPKNFYS